MTQSGRAGMRLTSDAVVSIVLTLVAVLYAVEAKREGLGTMADTGAGFFPFLVALVLVASGAVVVLQELRSDGPALLADEDDGDFQGEVHWWRIGGVLLASLAVPLVGNVLGFVVTLSIAFVVIAKVMGLAGWTKPVVLGVAFGASVWLVFVRWLFVPLPTGVLGLG